MHQTSTFAKQFMKTYSFTVILDDEEITEELANRVYETGCYDASCGSTAGIVCVDADREADSLEDVFRSATLQLEQVGCTIKRIEIDDSAMWRMIA